VNRGPFTFTPIGCSWPIARKLSTSSLIFVSSIDDRVASGGSSMMASGISRYSGAADASGAITASTQADVRVRRDPDV
jgi:hypothetical protein